MHAFTEPIIAGTCDKVIVHGDQLEDCMDGGSTWPETQPQCGRIDNSDLLSNCNRHADLLNYSSELLND